jgi:hypothetical protein
MLSQFNFHLDWIALKITLHEDPQRVFKSRQKEQIPVYKYIYISVSYRYLSEEKNSSAESAQKNKTRNLYQKHITAYDIIRYTESNRTFPKMYIYNYHIFFRLCTNTNEVAQELRMILSI